MTTCKVKEIAAENAFENRYVGVVLWRLLMLLAVVSKPENSTYSVGHNFGEELRQHWLCFRLILSINGTVNNCS